MKSKDAKKREDIPPLEDDALDAVTGGTEINGDALIVQMPDPVVHCKFCGRSYTYPRRGGDPGCPNPVCTTNTKLSL